MYALIEAVSTNSSSALIAIVTARSSAREADRPQQLPYGGLQEGKPTEIEDSEVPCRSDAAPEPVG
jgi:hypothetical protein